MLSARIVLGLIGLMFAGFGALLLVRPQALGSMVGVELPTAASRVEIRTFYGGLELGLAALAVIGILRPAWTGAALLGLALATGGCALGRIAGLVVEGTAERALLVALLIEASSAVAATWALWSLPSPTDA